ncbi:MAG TPA: FAD-dependent oxidoreductase [Phnomibacter sp.]|nr:FAD-dependent oxidoreductase [Phnomibacter sp.]
MAQKSGAGFFVASKQPVLIIGAGFAGLSAAYALRKKKIPVTVLEARNRIGGRVFSFAPPEANGQVIELGAEWVGASHERLIAMCEEFKLPLDNNQFDTRLVYKGVFHDKNAWDYSEPWKLKWEALKKAYPKLTDAQKRAIDQYDWWRYLVNNGCQGRDLDLRELLDSTDFGESIRHVSAFGALAEYAESSEKNEMDYKIRGGNGKLAEALADAVGREHIKTGMKVQRVVQTGSGVEVICTDGQRFKGAKLICTAPTFAVKQIQWQPALPPEVQRAMNQLQYARINKHPLLFAERFWKDESFDMVTDMPAHYFYHATKNQAGPQGILISYTIGDKAAVIANQPDEINSSLALAALQPGFGNVGGLLQKQWNYYWGNDEYSHGAYALYGAGQWFTLMPILRKPHVHTHFAGEHLADWQGFMEGAINTGEEAAEKIIKG